MHTQKNDELIKQVGVCEYGLLTEAAATEACDNVLVADSRPPPPKHKYTHTPNTQYKVSRLTAFSHKHILLHASIHRYAHRQFRQHQTYTLNTK